MIISTALCGCNELPVVALTYPEIDNNPVMIADVSPPPIFAPTEPAANTRLS